MLATSEAGETQFVVADRVLNNMRSILDGENLLPGMKVDELRKFADGRFYTQSQFERHFQSNWDTLEEEQKYCRDWKEASERAWKAAESETQAWRDDLDKQMSDLRARKAALPRRLTALDSPRKAICSVREEGCKFLWRVIQVNDADGMKTFFDKNGVFVDDLAEPPLFFELSKKRDPELPGEDMRLSTLVLTPDSEGWPALHLAAKHAAAEVAAALIERVPWIVDARPIGRVRATPLHLAAEGNNLDVARILLKQKAKLHSLNEIGETPMEKAKQRNLLRMEQLLTGFALARWHGTDK
ncbi:unnamed protein product [Amoebophrya sp. A25]|nr:unnamed protein product [Amoebophrya sp. A25]|eukprot:GSA25T00024778001.1